jgi:penicillin-binding protein 1A
MLTDERRAFPAADPAPPLGPVPEILPPPPSGKARRRWRIAAGILAVLLLLFAWLAITAPLSKSLQPIAAPGLTLLSSDGKPIARRGAIIDAPVDVTRLPDYVPNAFIAIEDRRFYNHSGIDPWGIGRAAIRNTLAGGVREGGSTITQQLAKLAFLSADRTATRKLQEVILAFWLEAWLSKDEILSRYLSSAYFGDNVYGLRAASHHYFSREPEELTLGQAAMLAGLMKAPSRLAPTSNLEGARERGRVVVAAMVDAGLVTRAEADALKPVRLKVEPIRNIPTGTYFADWVFPEARAATETGYGEHTVMTTLDSDLQRLAIRAIRRAGIGSAQVALVAMHPDGRVVAMVGGKDYKDSAFNRTTQARRQPGSTFKLFVYLAALRAGMTPDSEVLDEPLTIGTWSPRNSDGRYRGPISLRQAFAISSNVAAVRLTEEVGRDAVIRAARDLGVTSPLTTEPSLALGTSGVSLIEMVSAYAAVAKGDYPVKARGLPDAEEAGWFQSLRSRIRRFSDRSTRPALLELLHASPSEGTGRAAALPVETFGKTGTSQDNRDAIFIGFAGDLVVGVWIGNDDNSPLKGVHGGGLPARIWHDFMMAALELQPRHKEKPISIEEEAPDASLDVPLDETDYNLGVTLAPDGLTISATPAPGQPGPTISGEIPISTIAPPPPPMEPPPPGNGQ